MKILEFKGTHYEIGLQCGKYFYGQTQKLYKSLIFSDNILNLAEKSLEYFEATMPDLVEQMRGFSRGSHQSFLKVVAYLAYQYEVTEGSEKCTTLLVPGQNGPMLAHSEDDYLINEDKFFIAKFFPRGKPAYISGYYVGLLPGDNFGMNEFGLTISVNSLTYDHKSHNRQLGLPLSLIGNHLLKMKNLKEARIFLQKIMVSHGCHFLIVSPEGIALSAELLPNGKKSIKELTTLAHANHPLDRELIKYCKTSLSSAQRQKMLSAWLKEHLNSAVTVEDLQTLLKSKACGNLGICRNGLNIYKDIRTLGAFIAEPQKRTLWVTKGEPCRAKKWYELKI